MSLPLHPVVVHIPMALAVLLPIVAIAVAWSVLRPGRRPGAAWLALVIAQAVLVGSAFAAMNTGQREEDRVERVVSSTLIHEHEEFAEQFTWTASGVLLVSLFAFVRRERAARAAIGVTVLGTLLVAALGVRVGHAGGSLVYVHGAGAAYVSPQPQAPAPEDRDEH